MNAHSGEEAIIFTIDCASLGEQTMARLVERLLGLSGVVECSPLDPSALMLIAQISEARQLLTLASDIERCLPTGASISAGPARVVVERTWGLRN